MSASKSVASKRCSKIKYCCKFPHCKNSYISNPPEGHKNISYFSFPKDPSKLISWQKACNILPSKNCSNYSICRDHFLLSDFNNPNYPKTLSVKAIPKSIKIKVHDEHNYASIPNSSTSCFEENMNSFNESILDIEEATVMLSSSEQTSAKSPVSYTPEDSLCS